MVDQLIVLAVAFGVTFGGTPIACRLALRVGAVVAPDARRVHPVPTPVFGGVAMFAGFLVSFAVAAQLGRFRGVFEHSSEAYAVLFAASIIFVIGLLDDLRPVSAPAKLAGQVVAGSTLYLLGVTMLLFRIPFADTVVLSADLAPLVTVLWVVGMANAVNLIDGLDGLATGVVGIAAGAYFLYSDRLLDVGIIGTDNLAPLLALIVLGMCLGFLPHNFNPARIFMGDAGAMLLGVLMASATIVVGGRTDDPFSGQTFFFFAPLFIPLFILGVPILDLFFAIVRRVVGRVGVSVPDKQHLHHRLVALGHGHRRAVLIMWLWTALLSGFVLYPTYTGKGDHVVPFGVAAIAIALVTMLHPQWRSRSTNGELAGSEQESAEAHKPLAGTGPSES